jgi:transcriptional regulator with XRE-family HTH domain
MASTEGWLICRVEEGGRLIGNDVAVVFGDVAQQPDHVALEWAGVVAVLGERRDLVLGDQDPLDRGNDFVLVVGLGARQTDQVPGAGSVEEVPFGRPEDLPVRRHGLAAGAHGAARTCRTPALGLPRGVQHALEKLPRSLGITCRRNKYCRRGNDRSTFQRLREHLSCYVVTGLCSIHSSCIKTYAVYKVASGSTKSQASGMNGKPPQKQAQRRSDPPEISVELGRKLKELRHAAALSQQELALRCELDRTYISLIERGQANPSLWTLGTLAHVLGTTVPAMLAGNDHTLIPASLPGGTVRRNKKEVDVAERTRRKRARLR